MLSKALIKHTTSLVFNIFLRLYHPISQGRVSGLKSSLVLLILSSMISSILREEAASALSLNMKCIGPPINEVAYIFQIIHHLHL